MFTKQSSVLLMALLWLAGAPAQGIDPVSSFRDGTGREVAFGQDAQRVVSLAPNVTEMLFFLKLGSRVVGRSDFCDYPPEARALPTVGGFVDTSLEQIIALRPDLVVAHQGNSLELVSQLRKVGVQVLAFSEAGTLAEVGEQMEVLWRITGKPGATPTELVVWKKRLETETIRSYPQAKFFRFFFGYPGEVAYSAAPGSFIDDLLRRAGATNVVGDGSQRWPQVSAEFILASQPEWILTATDCTEDEDPKTKLAQVLAELRADKVWAGLPAVKAGQVVVLDSDILLRPGPRLLDALYQLNKELTRHMVDEMVRNAA